MSESSSPLHRFIGDPGASSAVCANAPEDGLRRLLDGVSAWLRGSASGAAADRCFGVVTGAPGRGQRELFDALEDLCRGRGLHVLRARAYPHATAPPGLTGRLIRGILEIQSTAHAADGRHGSAETAKPDRFREVLLEVTAPPRGPLETGREPSREQHRQRLIDAVVCALLEVVPEEPVVLVLEDLDAADELFRDVFEHLTRVLHARRAGGSLPRLLAIVGVRDRPQARSVFSALGGAADELVAFELETPGYSASDLGRLSEGLIAGDVGPSVREAILRRTRGDVSHVRWLLLRVLAELRSGRWSGDRDVWSRLLSWSVPRLVATCLAQLTEEECRVLSTLAVLEAAVPVPLARRIAGVTDAGLSDRSLDGLCGTGWVTLTRGATRSATEIGLADAGIARAVSENLSREERRSLRRRAARILERESRQDPRWLPLVLGQVLNDSADVPEDETLRAAAWYLPRVASPEEALGRLDDALRRRIAADSSGCATWFDLSARLLREAGETKRAIEVYGNIRDSTGETELKARCCREIGDLMRELNPADERIETYEKGLALFSESESSRERLKLLCSLTLTCLEAGRMAQARREVERCVEVIVRAQEVTRDECLEVYRLALEVSSGEPTGGERIEQVLGRCRPGIDALHRFRSLCRIAQVYRERGCPDRELSFLKEAAETARESRSRALAAEAGWRRARALKERGECVKAMTGLRRSLEVFSELGDCGAAQRTGALLLLAELEAGKLSRAGRRARALADSWIRAALAERKAGSAPTAAVDLRRQEPPGTGSVSAAFHLVVLARTALLEGDFGSAERDLERALRELEDSPSGSAVAVAALRTAAQSSLATGDLARAYARNLRGLRCALEARSPDGAAEALLGFCEYFLQGGTFATAVGVARGGLALLRITSSPQCELPLRRLLGRLGVEIGDARLAEEEFDKAMRLAASFDMPAETCAVCLERGWERLRSGDVGAASSLADQGLQIARRCAFHPLRAELLHLVGAADSASPDSRERAADALEEALAESRARALRRLEWDVLVSNAALYEALGREELAREAARRADEIETRVLGELPHMLRGIRWRCRGAVVNSRRRKSTLSACAG